MAAPYSSNTLNPTQLITATQVDHLPIFANYARRLGLVEIANRLVPVEMEVEPSARYPLGKIAVVSSGGHVQSLWPSDAGGLLQ